MQYQQLHVLFCVYVILSFLPFVLHVYQYMYLINVHYDIILINTDKY